MYKRLIISVLVFFAIILIFFSYNSICNENDIRSENSKVIVKEKFKDECEIQQEEQGEKISLNMISGLIDKNKKEKRVVTVAILDTGIYPHKDLTVPKNKIVKCKDFINNLPYTYDDNGHGTAIAGIIGGSGVQSNGLQRGICNKVNFVSVKILDYNGNGTSEELVEGINWVIKKRKKYNIDIINISVGFYADDCKQKEEIENVIERADEEGLLIFSSSGNMKKENSPIFPGAIKNVIAVGSIGSYKSGYKISSFSHSWKNDVSKPDIYSFGENIMSLDCDEYYKREKKQITEKGKKYKYFSGTSYATAIVTGVAAKILAQNPGLNHDELLSMLFNTEQYIYDDFLDEYKPMICHNYNS